MRQATVRGVTLTTGTVAGLSFIQKYRFLTIAQFARVAKFSNYHAGITLRNLEARNAVGYSGFTMIPGHGKTPKVYYLKRKGFEFLLEGSKYSEETIGQFVEVSPELTWTPQMYHRLRLIDLFISLEVAVAARENLELIQTLIEYRRIKGTHLRETTDYVGTTDTPENRMVPDGAFVLENTQTGRRGLFFVEMDMGTERITAPVSRDQRATIRGKFEQYDRYLTSGRFAQTYAGYGEFRSFLLLFVTYGQERIDNIRRAAGTLPERLHGYYRLAEFEDAIKNFLGAIWATRSPVDTLRLPLVQQGEETAHVRQQTKQ